MKLKEFLDLEVFKEAQLLSKPLEDTCSLSQEIENINVLEAPDLAQWISPHTVLLSSYYALNNLSRQELRDFVTQAKLAQVSCIVIKRGRLIDKTPQVFIDLCKREALYLIEIGPEVLYSQIIMSTMLPLINKKASLLDHYYQAQLKLKELKDKTNTHMLPREQHTIYQLDKLLDDIEQRFKIALHLKRTSKKGLQNHYSSGFLRLIKEQGAKGAQDLGIHGVLEFAAEQEFNSKLDMDIQSIANFLELELVHLEHLETLISFNKHNLVHELLMNTQLSKQSIQSMLASIQFKLQDSFMVLELTILDTNDDKDSRLHSAEQQELLHKLAHKIKNLCSLSAYSMSSERLSIIMSFSSDDEALKHLNDFKVCCSQVLDHHGDWIAGLSSCGKAFDLNRLEREAQQVKDVLRSLKRSRMLMNFDELGIYKLFGKAELINMVEDFIPKQIKQLAQEEPLLFETLCCYVQQGQSIQKTADHLFVHPKTVSYRLNKIHKNYDFDLSDSSFILQIQLSSQLLLTQA